MGYEQRDVDPRLPVRIGAAMVVFLLLGILVVTGVMLTLWAVDKAPASPFGQASPTTSGPPVQADPRADMQALTQRWDRQLGSIGWVDRDAGLVRIPIEAAMTQTARAGWRDGPEEGAP